MTIDVSAVHILQASMNLQLRRLRFVIAIQGVAIALIGLGLMALVTRGFGFLP